jgi:hypothetical protein
VPKLPYSVLPAKVSSEHLASLHGVGQLEWQEGGGHPTSGAFAMAVAAAAAAGTVA